MAINSPDNKFRCWFTITTVDGGVFTTTKEWLTFDSLGDFELPDNLVLFKLHVREDD